jgi:hypothetical protein
MVDKPQVQKLGQVVVFAMLLGVLAAVVTGLGHIRVGALVLRACFGIFNLCSVLYVLSLASQYLWEKSARLAVLASSRPKESADAGCD